MFQTHFTLTASLRVTIVSIHFISIWKIMAKSNLGSFCQRYYAKKICENELSKLQPMIDVDLTCWRTLHGN
jgi:hypothetical protein